MWHSWLNQCWFHISLIVHFENHVERVEKMKQRTERSDWNEMHAYWSVDSFSISILLSHERALARQKSCRWSCESEFSFKETSRSSKDVTLPHKSTHFRVWIIAWSETASFHELAFSRTVFSKRKDFWVTRLSLNQTSSEFRVKMLTSSISICSWWHDSRHSKAATRLLLSLWTAWSGESTEEK